MILTRIIVIFLASLLNCDECRNNFSLCIKCAHFGNKRRKFKDKGVFFQTTCHHHQDLASTLSVGIVQTFTYGECQTLTIVFYEGLIQFLAMKKRSNTIHAQNVFYYDIESRLEERLECRFQETTESGDTVTVRKSVTLLQGLVNLHNLKEKLTERELKCMEVAHCKSHQPTFLCVVNSMQSIKRHFCESECDNVITNFFSWIVTEILKPMNCRKDQKNDYVFVAHNGSPYDSQFIYKNAHDFFGSRNVQVLMQVVMYYTTGHFFRKVQLEV